MKSDYRYAVRATASNKLPRVTGLLLLEAKQCNPNGDSNDDGNPRLIGDKGMISNVSGKRKWRDLIADGHPAALAAMQEMKLDPSQYGIAMKKMEGTNDQVNKITKMLHDGRENGKFSHVDVRLFGGFFAPDKEDAKKKDTEAQDPFIQPGSLVMGHGISVAPIEVQTQGITRSIGMSQTKGGEDKRGGMGSLSFVRYGLYAFPIYFCPTAAVVNRSLVTADDLELFRRLIPFIGDQRSNTRATADVLHLYWYEHERGYGDIADHRILDAFRPQLIEGRSGQQREDYTFFDKSSELSKNTFGKHAEFAFDFQR